MGDGTTVNGWTWDEPSRRWRVRRGGGYVTARYPADLVPEIAAHVFAVEPAPPPDASMTSLYRQLDDTDLPGDPPFDVNAGLERFRAAVAAMNTGPPAAAGRNQVAFQFPTTAAAMSNLEPLIHDATGVLDTRDVPGPYTVTVTVTGVNARATPAEVFTRPVTYEVGLFPPDHEAGVHFNLRVEYRSEGRWAVCWGGRQCLGVDGQWDWESGAQLADGDWLAAHRFHLVVALELAKAAAPGVEVNGRTAAEALARHREHERPGD